MNSMGEKIKTLRKQRNISQEVLANYLGISFQAVSKWETGSALPDVMLLPAIACFFGVSTDELFEFNVYTVEKNVQEIVSEQSRYWDTDKARCEQILREGLKKYPGNDVLLNCLVSVIPVPERAAEVVGLCKTLIEGTRCDEVRYDACRILAQAYHSMGEIALAKEAIENIPELYFTKLGVAAELLEGDDKLSAAAKAKNLAFRELIRMCECLAEEHEKRGEIKQAAMRLHMAQKLIEAVREDFATPCTVHLYEEFAASVQKYEERICELENKG